MNFLITPEVIENIAALSKTRSENAHHRGITVTRLDLTQKEKVYEGKQFSPYLLNWRTAVQ